MATRNLSSGQFPTMGNEACRVTARPPSKGTMLPGAPQGKEVPEPKTAVVRDQVHRPHGFVGGVKAMRSYQNAEEAAATERKVKPIGASHNGRAEFDSRRQYSGE